MTFETLALIIGAAIVPLFFIASFIKKILKFNESFTVNAIVIGYKKSNSIPIFNNHKPLTKFWPIITFTKNDKEITSTIKNISLLISVNSSINIRLTKDNKYLPIDFFFDIFTLGFCGLVLMIIFLGSSFVGQYVLILVLATIVALIFLLYDQHKNLGTLQDALMYVSPKCPENYEDLTENDFKKIEESDLVTYEEAMAHYYHQNKKSEKRLYPLIAIGIVAAIAYKVFW